MISRIYSKMARVLTVVFLVLAADVVLFAGPEDSPLYRFRPENHAAEGHQGRVNALVFVSVPAEDGEPVEEAGTVVHSEPVAEAETVADGEPATEDSGPVTEDGTVADSESATDTGPVAETEPAEGTGGTAEGESVAAGYVLTAGEDGFLGIWSQETASAVERYQLSELPVSLMKAHPVRSEIAYVESDGLAFHRLCVMNYWTKTPLFSLDFEDRINYIDYTAGGSFLVVITGGRGAIQILDSQTGRAARPEIAIPAVFAAASPTERTLVVYSQTGRLSYWNLQTGRQTAEFPATAAFLEPVIFRNYNLLAGWVNNELVVINATNGRTLIRDRTIPRGILLPVAWDDEKFAVSSPSGVTVYSIGLTGNSGTLVPEIQLPVTTSIASIASITSINSGRNGSEENAAVSAMAMDGFFLGTENGGLVRLEKEGGTTVFSTAAQIRVTDALVRDGTIHYITATGSRGEMPVDYGAILDGEAVTLPTLPGTGSSSLPTAAFPVSELNGKLLYLEAQGPVVRAAEDGGPGRELLSAFLPLAIDADFADDENIVVAGMLPAGDSLLQLISIATGETVPVDVPDNLALKIYRGKSGSLYAALIAKTGGRTSIVKLDTRNPRQSRRLVEIGFEDDDFDMAETGGTLVTNLGSATVNFYDTTRGNLLISGERTGGMSSRIINGDGGDSVLVIDAEGSLAWLDRTTGRVQAVMRVYADEWELSASDGRRANGR
ncbi:MAG: hypothetical protein LBK61_08865 [Spirochaetaceae bacterium]|jgi:hypothetical protein|nr:hypothetical protein [Spirochaetaceae bacterium]